MPTLWPVSTDQTAPMHGTIREATEADVGEILALIGELADYEELRHEAVATTRDLERTSGTVVDEAGRGYFWNHELLRPARVRVAE